MQEQTALNHNLIINEREWEVTTKNVIGIATTLQVDISEIDIKTAFRKTPVGRYTTGVPRTIVVTFKNKKKRDTILSSKLAWKITSKSFNQNTREDRPVYFGEQLTGRKQFLSRMVLEK